MATDSLKVFFALSIFAVILLAGWYPFKKRLRQDEHFDFPLGETLATGVFLGAALLHMLPESNDMFSKLGYQYPFAFIITGIVFLIFLWFEHLGKELYHHHEANRPVDGSCTCIPTPHSRDRTGAANITVNPRERF